MTPWRGRRLALLAAVACALGGGARVEAGEAPPGATLPPKPPSSYEVLLAQAQALHRDGRYEEAVRTLDRARNLRPDQAPKLLLSVGNLYVMMVDPERALDSYKRAGGDVPEPLRKKIDDMREAMRQYRGGDFALALEYMQQCCVEEDNDGRRTYRVPRILLYMRNAYLRLGRTRDAQQAFQRYLDLVPRGPERLRRDVQGPIVHPQEPAPPEPPRPTARSTGRTAAGAVLVGSGLLLSGLGIGALAMNGRVADESDPSSGLYETMPLGTGLLVPGLVLLASGTLVLTIPERRRR